MPRDEWVDPVPMPEEKHEPLLDESGLRPRSLSDFVGQRELKERLEVMLIAARQRGQAADHLLFGGPPGLGKTTLAGIVAHEMGAHLHVTSGPAIEKAGDLASILTKLETGDVIFIDEIHRLPRMVEEVLYPAMEDRQIDVMVGSGPAARSIRFELEEFTLVGATTRTGLITGPLRDRFGFDFRLEFYSASDLEQIVTRAAGVLELDITAEGATEIARRSRGTPRIANRLLKRVRDFAEVRSDGRVDLEAASDGLALFGIDERGLDKIDRRLLENICVHFGGGPVGLSTLAISLAEPAETVEDVIEPFLIQQGLLMRTPRGRVALPAAWRHLGKQPPDDAPQPGVHLREGEATLFEQDPVPDSPSPDPTSDAVIDESG
ncbi:MAG: Holliday junction DNA helicase RuvB [Acidimicrobiales bacterium]|jgi:holliday junction DNA helicase RuvB